MKTSNRNKKLLTNKGSIIIQLTSERLPNPDLDLRYLIPDTLEEHFKGQILNNGYDYDDQNKLLLFLSTDNAAKRVGPIIAFLQAHTFLGNSILDGAVITIADGSENHYTVFPPTSSSHLIMNSLKNVEIKDLIKKLSINMIKYRESCTPNEPYPNQAIDECMEIIDGHIREMEQVDSKEKALKILKKTVLALNELNEKYNYALIETDERDLLVDIIIFPAVARGYTTKENDITKEWRMW